MNSVSLGRYVPYDSFIHRLDARSKIVSMIFLMVAVFLPFGNYATTFLMGGLTFIVVFSVFLFTRIRISALLKSLLSLWLMLVFLLLIYAITPRQDHLDWISFYIGGYPIYWASILDAAKIFVRLMLMIALSLSLTASTKPLDLTGAFEWYMFPLKLVAIPVSVWAMTLSLALRFIPTLLDDVERIMKAQAARGVDFKRGRFSKKVKALTSLIVPLFVSSISRSDELANAMEARGYDPNEKRTRYREMRFHLGDLFAVLLTGAYMGFAIWMSVSGFDPFMAFWGLEVR